MIGKKSMMKIKNKNKAAIKPKDLKRKKNLNKRKTVNLDETDRCDDAEQILVRKQRESGSSENLGNPKKLKKQANLKKKKTVNLDETDRRGNAEQILLRKQRESGSSKNLRNPKRLKKQANLHKRKTANLDETDRCEDAEHILLREQGESGSSKNLRNPKKLRKQANLKKRKTANLDETDRCEDAEHILLTEQRESGSSKNLRNPKKLKKQAITELNELRDILGVKDDRDEKEKELEDFIFGHDSDGLEELEESASDSDTDKETEKTQDKNVDKKPVWEDEDDENILVEEKVETLKNCHRSMVHKGKEKYSSFVRDKLKSIVGESSWAELGRKASSDEDNDDELLKKTGNFIQSSKTLPKGLIRMQKCPSLVDESLKNAIVKCVEFHPTARVAIVAGTNGTANLFQIDGKINAKIQSVYFENFPIHAAHFTLNGKEIIVGSNKFGHFFSYDMMSGKVLRIPWDKGMEQKNIRRFHMSPDNKYIVIQGRYGYIHIVTANSKEWIGSLKMNGEVISVAFNKDGSKMYSHGDTGEVYVWDMNTRRCIHKFVDEGCVIGTSLALSPNNQFLASGSDSGVVNIYDNTTLFESNSPKPVKVLMNLTTEVTQMKFNCTSELLAMSSFHKENAVKLVHFPSMTTYSNFPIREDLSSLRYINALDISVNSGYLCLGNNLSTVHIFRLKHYNNY